MYDPEGGFTGKAVELGELPIKYAANHGKYSVQQRQIHIPFIFRSPLLTRFV